MVIESRYWREDLERYARAFRPVTNPPRWSERLVVNFEKDVCVSLFMVRRLAEAGRFSSRMRSHRARIFRCQFSGRVHRLIYRDIDELYDLDSEEEISRSVAFVCNQFIHADFTYAIRGIDRNWAGLYTSSDFEKRRWIYRVPLPEIVKILEMAVVDCPTMVAMRYDRETEEWDVNTD